MIPLRTALRATGANNATLAMVRPSPLPILRATNAVRCNSSSSNKPPVGTGSSESAPGGDREKSEKALANVKTTNVIIGGVLAVGILVWYQNVGQKNAREMANIAEAELAAMTPEERATAENISRPPLPSPAELKASKDASAARK